MHGRLIESHPEQAGNMSAARQERKSERLKAVLAAIAAAGLVLIGLGLAPAPSRATTTERVVVNRHTGFAIHGFDPVAYFVDGAPSLGRPGLEFRYAGVTWRFRNEGNRAAFAADPAVYVPRFGGHDPVAAARGVGTPGHPSLWAVVKDRLYLFYSVQARAVFLDDPQETIRAAERQWPEVLRTLAP
jgi:hypothetical protein